ncbi:MAG: CobW family GTP-binding protein [Eubacteriales bacterium]|nr:CobW family GTP-binding protein [Eubacteriales bacterium]
MTKLLLITGFLGAGKTTLLNRILTEYAPYKAGVIVNEYGSAAVDDALLEGHGTDMTLLKNGSVFCACLKDDFIKALVDMSRADIDYLFVEASGLSDPANMVTILEAAKQAGSRPYNYLGAVCVADAVRFTRHVMVLPALSSQIAYSGAVIINKTDLITPEEADDVEEKVHAINPSAVIYRAVRCDVPIYSLARCRSVSLLPAESSNKRTGRLRAVTLRSGESPDRDKLLAFVGEIGPLAYRVKGFCRTGDGGLYISAAGDLVESEACDLPDVTELVIISSVGISIISKILEAAEKCFSEPPELK